MVGFGLLTKGDGGLSIQVTEKETLDTRSSDWSSFPVIIHGGKMPVCMACLCRLGNGSVLVFFKIPTALEDAIVPPSPDGSSMLLGIPCQSQSLITVSEAYWGNLLRAVSISYLCASTLSIFLPSTCNWGS